MTDDITIFSIEKTLNGLMIKKGMRRVNLVSDPKVLPGYALVQQGNVISVNPDIFRQLTAEKEQDKLIALMKTLKVI